MDSFSESCSYYSRFDWKWDNSKLRFNSVPLKSSTRENSFLSEASPEGFGTVEFGHPRKIQPPGAAFEAKEAVIDVQFEKNSSGYFYKATQSFDFGVPKVLTEYLGTPASLTITAVFWKGGNASFLEDSRFTFTLDVAQVLEAAVIAYTRSYFLPTNTHSWLFITKAVGLLRSADLGSVRLSVEFGDTYQSSTVGELESTLDVSLDTPQLSLDLVSGVFVRRQYQPSEGDLSWELV
jgi:hypothetical protein